jgi:gliding motility-associated-like protein
MKKIISLITVLLYLGSLNAQTVMPIGPQTNWFSSMVRGYHFTSPVAFNICALYIPPDAPGAAGQNQHIRVVRFTAGNPPAFPGTTNAFVQLFTITNAAPNATVPCNIPVNPGDVIGVYGARAGNCINSYDGVAFNTTIMGQPTTCRRSGMQNCISAGQPMANIWSEINYNIGRIFIYYNCCPTPTITTAASATNICAGASVTILGGGASNYTWTPGNMNTSSVIVTPSVTTTYTLTGETAGCSSNKTVAVQVSNFPNYTVTPQTTTICNNSSFTTTMTLATPTVAYSYTYMPPANMLSPNSSVTVVNPNIITTSLSTQVFSVIVTPTLAFCPVQQTFAATVVNPLTPTLNPVGPLCTSFAPVNLTASPPGGSWSGNPAVSSTGVFTPSLASVGNNTVMYSIVINSCTATNTMAINVSQFNPATITGTIGHQCHNFPIVNLMGIVQSTVNGSWSGSGVTSNSFNPAGLPTAVYTLTYSTTSSPNATLCPDLKTINISVLNPPTPAITGNTIFCNNHAPVQLGVAPSTGSWIPNGYLSFQGVFSPSNAAIGANAVQYMIGTPTCNVTSSLTINIEQFVSAAITNTVPDKCSTDPVISLSALVASQTGTWTGPGVNSGFFNPASSGVGALTLTYNTHSIPTASLCPDNSVLTINVFSLAPAQITNAGPLCNTQSPFKLNVTPLGGQFYSLNSQVVDFTGLFQPMFANIGPNVVSYSISSGPCIAVTNVTVNVEKFVPAQFTKYPGPYCKNDPQINLFNFVQYYGGTFSGPGIVNGNIFDPSQANVGDNNEIIYSTHSVPTASLCPDTAMVRIKINDYPKVTINSSIEKGCEPLEVLFNTPDVNTGTGTWYFGDGSAPVNGLSTVHTYTNHGSFNVLFVFKDEIGCSTSATLPGTIMVHQNPKAFFDYGPEKQLSLNNSTVTFSNQSISLGHNTYSWQIGELYTLNQVHPQVVFPEARDYLVTLTATSFEGCKSSYSQLINVKHDFGVYIPNAFTPNYDGLNDYFRPEFTPYGFDKDFYEFQIFDRWGIIVFQTREFGLGWDGTKFNRGDEMLKEGVYVYKLKYRDSEGKIYNRTGHVTLMK